jgi:hypothetical protein
MRPQAGRMQPERDSRYVTDITVERKSLSYLRTHARSIREHASGRIYTKADKQAVARYKQLVFDAARKLDEAAKVLPEEQFPVVNQSVDLWVYLLAGGMFTVVCFLAYVAFMRFVMGTSIGFIN